MQCPKCDFFGDDEDVIAHHTRVHNGKETYRCEDCRGNPSFSGAMGYFQHRRQKHGETASDMPENVLDNMSERETYVCKQCGDTFRRYEYETGGKRPQFCSWGCYQESGGRWKDYNTAPNRVLTCGACGDKFERVEYKVTEKTQFCSQSCRNTVIHSGENNYHYIDGRNGDRYYGTSWPKRREQARTRDFYRCRVCNISDEECIDKYGCELHVHHKTPFRYFDNHKKANRLHNLITVCPRCHGTLEKELSG